MLPNGNGNSDQSALETLAEVKLQQFSATPAVIGPFGESTVRWVVSGQPTPFTVTLNGTAVDLAGSLLVQPFITTPYTISARAGAYTRPLGSIAVQVDLFACQIIAQPAGGVRKMLSTFIKNEVLQADSSLNFQNDPEITFQPGLIQIVLNLSKRINPDASLQVTILMGLAPSSPRRKSLVEPCRVKRKRMHLFGSVSAWSDVHFFRSFSCSRRRPVQRYDCIGGADLE